MMQLLLVHLCIPVYSCVHLCIAVYTSEYLFTCGCVYHGILVYTRVYFCIQM